MGPKNYEEGFKALERKVTSCILIRYLQPLERGLFQVGRNIGNTSILSFCTVRTTGRVRIGSPAKPRVSCH